VSTSTGYREPHPRCPGCRGELFTREISAAVIDVCRDCGGLWVDWHDGDLSEVVRGSGPRGAPSTAPSAAPPEAPIVPVCPRCSRPLHDERYRDDGPAILRCGECAGAFVPRASAGELASLSVRDDEDDSEAGFFRRLILRVRAALGMSP
jgi:Zn-finger nucleic acid-binding protein